MCMVPIELNLLDEGQMQGGPAQVRWLQQQCAMVQSGKYSWYVPYLTYFPTLHCPDCVPLGRGTAVSAATFPHF